MPLLPIVGRKSPGNRLFVAFVYSALILLGTTMVVQFMITLSGSTTNDFDYERFSPIPRYCWSRADRFTKGLVYFFNDFRGWREQLHAYAPPVPDHWTAWNAVGRDVAGVNAFAAPYLDADPPTTDTRRRIAADYAEFCEDYPLSDTTLTAITPQAVNFMEDCYTAELLRRNPEAHGWSGRRKRDAALKLLGEAWGLPYESFYNVNFDIELNAPMDFQTWFPSVDDPKYQDFLRLKEAYRAQVFTPGVREAWLDHLKRQGVEYADVAEVFPVMRHADERVRALWREFQRRNAPASPCIPYALRAAWYRFLASDEAAKRLGLPPGELFSVARYNAAAGTRYARLAETPFPLPASFGEPLAGLWRHYAENFWPLRLTSIRVGAESAAAYQAFLRDEIKHLRIANELLGTSCTDWSGFVLAPTAPGGSSEAARNRANVWRNFVSRLPMEKRVLTCSEIAYQRFLSQKYGSLDAINRTYGWDLAHIEEAFPPFVDAYAVTFANHEWSLTLKPILRNYRVIAEYLTRNANAVPVTLLLIVMAVFCTLAVNPLAAYAMSRFGLRGKELVLLFMLATMAFPAMVSAIPAYLLMRDLGLLNTFFALVLPGAANGMAIFVLKGFFDSLPQELFEAATIDGASESQIFRIVAMPMVKPILAINSLSAFMAAYNGWEWALIVCQDKKMWTLAVWLYQANQWWNDMPWIVSAGFIVASIPTFLVFISCQKIILRGIVIPSMK